MGAGSVRCSPPVIAALATYFGERPLEIRLYDSDEERLDLFDRMARWMFASTKAPHRVLHRLDPREALEKADRVILQVGTNCARKYMRAIGQLPGADDFDYHEPPGSLQKDGYLPLRHDAALVQRAIEAYLLDIPADAEVLSLQNPAVALPAEVRFRTVSWPSEISLEERLAVPHQILRWMRGEDYAHSYLSTVERSPLKAWLDDPATASSAKLC